MERILFSLIFFTATLTGFGQANDYYLHWINTVGSPGDDRATSMVMDHKGYVYVTGYFSGNNIDFDQGPGSGILSSTGASDVFIAKYEISGKKIVWAKKIAGTLAEGIPAPSLTLDSLGHIIILSNTVSSDVDHDPSAGTYFLPAPVNPDTNMFISRYDSHGNFKWAKQIDARASESGTGIATDLNGNIYITGSFNDIVDFNPGGTPQTLNGGAGAIFIAKYDSLGAFQWVRHMTGASINNMGNSLQLDPSGNIFLGGYFHGTNVDFDPGAGTALRTANSTTYDFFFSKYDANGIYQWVNTMGVTADNMIYELTPDASGNMIISGYFYDTIDFDPGPGVQKRINKTPGSGDLFLAKYDGNGNYVWALTAGGAGHEDILGVDTDPDGYIYVIGNYSSDTVDLDPGTGSLLLLSPLGSGFNTYVAKFDPSGNPIWRHPFNDPFTQYGLGIIADQYQNFYITGIYDGLITDFDPQLPVQGSPAPAGNFDFYFARYSPCKFITYTQFNKVKADEYSSLTLDLAPVGPSESFHWYKNGTLITDGGIISGATTQAITFNGIRYEDSGEYSFMILDTCGYPYKSQTFSLEVIPEIKAYELITPNNDNKNDVFFVTNIELFSDSEVVIYNKWGNTVFSKNNYKNDWDGGNLPDGPYFYYVKIPSMDVTLKGGLNISR